MGKKTSEDVAYGSVVACSTSTAKRQRKCTVADSWKPRLTWDFRGDIISENFKISAFRRRCDMIERFDLFKVDNDGVLWVGTAESLEDAKNQAKKHSQQCDFRVVDQTTGELRDLPRSRLVQA